jgi:hypothetical protein
MKRAARQRPAGQRDIGSLARQPDVEGDLLQPAAALGNCGLELLSKWVGQTAHARPVLSRELADATEERAQLTLAAEERRFDGLERLRIRGIVDSAKRTPTKFVELF